MQMESPAAGMGQIHTKVGGHLDRKQLCRTGPGSSNMLQFEDETATYRASKGSQINKSSVVIARV